MADKGGDKDYFKAKHLAYGKGIVHRYRRHRHGKKRRTDSISFLGEYWTRSDFGSIGLAGDQYLAGNTVDRKRFCYVLRQVRDLVHCSDRAEPLLER
jgi:hypothetical protein